MSRAFPGSPTSKVIIFPQTTKCFFNFNITLTLGVSISKKKLKLKKKLLKNLAVSKTFITLPLSNKKTERYMNNEKYVKLSKPIVRNGLDTLDELRIRIDHQKPSFNYFYGGCDKGGVYVYLTPVHRGNGFVSQTIDGNTHNSGYKILVKELGRKSQKQIDIAVERIMPFAETIGEVYGEGNHQQVYNLIKNAYNSEY